MISVFKNLFCFLLFFCVFHPRRRVWVKKPFMISLVRKYFSKYIKKFKVDEKAQKLLIGNTGLLLANIQLLSCIRVQSFQNL